MLLNTSNKSKRQATNIRLNPDVKAWLKAIAKKEKTSISEQVNRFLVERKQYDGRG